MDKPEVREACQWIVEDPRRAALFEVSPSTGPSRGAYNTLERSATWLARLP